MTGVGTHSETVPTGILADFTFSDQHYLVVSRVRGRVTQVELGDVCTRAPQRLQFGAKSVAEDAVKARGRG